MCRPSAVALLLACRIDMHDQPRLEPYEASPFFEDGAGSRTPPVGTVARGAPVDSEHHSGRRRGVLLEAAPLSVDARALARGRERYDIHCAPCHDRTGSGRGMIVQRGFKPPPSFHEPRLRAAPLGHFFEVVSNGTGAMFPYASRVSVEDRWAIASYVRALQLSQSFPVVALAPAERSRLEAAP